MEQTNEKPKKKMIYRWVFLVVLVLNIFAANVIPPVQSHIQLAAEPLTPTLFTFAGNEFQISNTLVATLLADVLIVLLALSIRRQIKQGKNVVTSVSGMFAMILEILLILLGIHSLISY